MSVLDPVRSGRLLGEQLAVPAPLSGGGWALAAVLMSALELD